VILEIDGELMIADEDGVLLDKYEPDTASSTCRFSRVSRQQCRRLPPEPG